MKRSAMLIAALTVVLCFASVAEAQTTYRGPVNYYYSTSRYPDTVGAYRPYVGAGTVSASMYNPATNTYTNPYYNPYFDNRGNRIFNPYGYLNMGSPGAGYSYYNPYYYNNSYYGYGYSGQYYRSGYTGQ